jgi:hypothetical protein
MRRGTTETNLVTTRVVGSGLEVMITELLTERIYEEREYGTGDSLSDTFNEMIRQRTTARGGEKISSSSEIAGGRRA